MNVNRYRILAATFLLAVSTVTANAAEPAPPPPPFGDMAPPGAPDGKCKQDRAACRKQAEARFEEHFKKLDTDGDGTLSRAEAEKGAPHLAENFAQIDANKDGKLTPDEIRNAMRARREQCRKDPEKCRAEMKQHFEAAWKKADTDGDGTLTKAEAEKGMPRLARHFEEIDTDKDGTISLAEVEAARARHPHGRRGPKPDGTPPATPPVPPK